MTEPTPTVESGLAIGALGVQRRVILRPGKDDMAFSFAIDSTCDRRDVYQIMDMITDVADREALKADLADKLDFLRTQDEREQQALADVDAHVTARATMVASQRAMHDVSGRRQPFKPSEKQRLDLERAEQSIENAKRHQRSVVRDRKIVEWKIACLRAQIAGAEPPEKPRELDDAMAELAAAA